MYKSLSQADIADLTRFLADPLRPEGTLRFQEVQGFLFAVACSPELVPPSAWLPAISDEEDIRFEDEAEAQRIMGLIIGLYNGINDLAANSTQILKTISTRNYQSRYGLAGS
jgi:uncharacterized protein